MLYIAEYSDIGSTTRGSIAIPLEPPAAEQAIEVMPSNNASAPFKAETCLVRLMSDEDCMIDIGTDPDATNSSRKLMAGKEQTITVPMGANFRVAVMSAGSSSVTGMDSLESLLKLIASPADAQKQLDALQDGIGKYTAAADDFRAAAADREALNEQLSQATETALKAKADAAKATADLAAREAAFDKDTQDHADKVKADQAALDERSKALDVREADLTARSAGLDTRGAWLSDLAASLDAKEKDLAAREAAVAVSQSDYEARFARLKALTA